MAPPLPAAAELLAPGFWEALCPGLRARGAPPAPPGAAPPPGLGGGPRAGLLGGGFACLAPGELAPAAAVAALARGVEALEAEGWPATFILVFDEAWALLERAAALVREASGNEPNLDVLAWKVDPARGQGGFSPHRDRQPADVAGSFRADGSARYVTCWVALSDATPENSCLYCVPAAADPGYAAGDRDDVDPLTRALGGNKESYQLIRALPCEAGGAVVFTHRLIHWGSRSSVGGAAGGGCAPPPPRGCPWLWRPRTRTSSPRTSRPSCCPTPRWACGWPWPRPR